MKISIFLSLIFIGIVGAGVMYNSGISGTTKKNGDGCVCHDPNFNAGVNVWVSGPATLAPGESANYTLYMTGGPAVKGGMNIAVNSGTLLAVSPNTAVNNSEIVHTNAKNFVNDTVSWVFQYTAPVTLGVDTIYSVGNSVNGDQIPTSLDKWNFGMNFPVVIDNIVPVELSAFSVSVAGYSAKLDWTTATETNNNYFSVEVMYPGTENFSSIGNVTGRGNSVEQNNYSYNVELNKPGKYLFRLKQNDFDGSFSYSNVIEAEVSGIKDYQLYQNFPNPFNPQTTISFTIPEDGSVKLLLYSVSGEMIGNIFNGNLKAGKHNINFDYRSLNNNLPSGVYIYSLISGQNSLSKKLIINK